MAPSRRQNTVLTDQHFPTMQIYHHISQLRSALNAVRQSGQRIALVPTMGNLHRGHIRLVEAASDLADHVVATIFVNPMQFAQHEDLDKYPSTPDADIEKLKKAGCHTLFAPPAREVYPDGLSQHTVVSVPGLSERLCGASRPGHFDGVATVVSKLFNIVQPDHAIFGLKDYQQFQVIRKMAADLCFNISITGVPTERDEHGLALSSRNGYMSASEKQTAVLIYATLQQTAEKISQGTRDYFALEQQAQTQLEAAGIKPDYFTVCQADTLAPATAADTRLVILTAAFVGTTRLIDNIEISLKN
jgi:pantoate--beta-alanine ligase